MRINLLNIIKATKYSIFYQSNLKKKPNLASVLKVNIMLTFPAIHKRCQNLLQL